MIRQHFKRLHRSIIYRSFSTDPILTSNEPAAFSPLLSSAAAPSSPLITQLVAQISSLSLLETNELVRQLKEKLGISNESLTFAVPQQSQQPGASSPISDAEPARVDFKLVLERFEATSKAKVIKEVKILFPSMNLVEAKNFVESLPKVIKEKCTKEEAEKTQKMFEGIGAAVKIE